MQPRVLKRRVLQLKRKILVKIIQLKRVQPRKVLAKRAIRQKKVQSHSSPISDNTICYVSDGGKCYHRLSSCAGKLNQQSTTVGRVKGSRSKCRKCW